MQVLLIDDIWTEILRPGEALSFVVSIDLQFLPNDSPQRMGEGFVTKVDCKNNGHAYLEFQLLACLRGHAVFESTRWHPPSALDQFTRPPVSLINRQLARAS